jgi:hypothetical protein
MAHSNWSASGFEQIMLCAGSKVLQKDKVRTATVYSAEGTAAHQVLTWALQQGLDASAFVGRKVDADGFSFEVTPEMAGHLQVTIDYVREIMAPHPEAELLVDQQVHYHTYLGLEEGEAWGTLDVAVLLPNEIVCIDLKYGMGVQVDAFTVDGGGEQPNPQLALYSLGAVYAFNGIIGDFNQARLVISQPRVSAKPSEFVMDIAALEAWAAGRGVDAVARAVKASAQYSQGDVPHAFLQPGDKQCRFCSAKATCPALRAEVASAVALESYAASPEDFESMTPVLPQDSSEPAWIAACLSKVDLIEDWCKAIRAEADKRMLEGQEIPGWKLVQGRKGARAWTDANEVETLLKDKVRLKTEDLYDFKLISPTTAEKLHKEGKIGPRQWVKVNALITQPEGKLHVAPVSDKRAAVVVKSTASEFDDVSLADLA